MRETRTVMRIENGEIVTLTADGVTVTDADGEPRERDIEEVTWDEDEAERGGYPTFMMKEIHGSPTRSPRRSPTASPRSTRSTSASWR